VLLLITSKSIAGLRPSLIEESYGSNRDSLAAEATATALGVPLERMSCFLSREQLCEVPSII
jgi:hypothetical protein